MYDRILVPVDGSPFSEEVIPYALGIVEATGAELTLLRIVERESQRAEVAEYLRALGIPIIIQTPQTVPAPSWMSPAFRRRSALVGQQ